MNLRRIIARIVENELTGEKNMNVNLKVKASHLILKWLDIINQGIAR